MQTIQERFWSKVNKNGPIPAHRPGLGRCWTWTAFVSNRGYGKIGKGGKRGGMLYAHRLSFSIANASFKLDSALWVLHKCDNRLCVKPTHLFAGTPKDNYHDMAGKGRRNCPRGERSAKSKLTAHQVLEIRRKYIRPVFSNVGELAKEYGVTKQSIDAIVTRKNWRHV